MQEVRTAFFEPTGRLSPWLDNYWMVQCRRSEPLRLRILAGGMSLVAVPLGGKTVWVSPESEGGLSEGLLVGPRKTWFEVRLARDAMVLFVIFRAGGLSRFLGPHAEGLLGATLPIAPTPLAKLSRAIEVAGKVLHEQSGKTQGDRPFMLAASSTFATIDFFLEGLLEANQAIDRREFALMRGIWRDPSAARLLSLHSDLDIGRLQLDASARRIMGITAKEFVVIARARRLYKRLLEREKGLGFADFALEYGFYDQSHAIRDLVRATGWTPGYIGHQVAQKEGDDLFHHTKGAWNPTRERS